MGVGAWASAIPSDYDDDPQRFLTWRPADDVHESVAERIGRERLIPILDLGVGMDGSLGRCAAHPAGSVSTDPRHCSRLLLDRSCMPTRSTSRFVAPPSSAVAALWMLYHLVEPAFVVAEAHRVLRPGGVFVACTSARNDAPELLPPADRTSFDAEEAPAIVASIFGEIEVEPWDDQLVEISDRDELRRYLVHHLADPALADEVEVPLRLTKHGLSCLGTKVSCRPVQGLFLRFLTTR